MSSHNFRVVSDEYLPDVLDHGGDSHAEIPAFASPETVCVNAGEVIALLMHAARTNRAWLADFAEESLEISQDMYEVLLAYRRMAQADNARAA